MPPTSTRISRRVLLVDDDAGIRHLLARVLSTIGCTVVTASDGVEALEGVSSQAFDLVISDVVMPKLDGVQLAARLRASQPHVPVLLISGFSDALAANPLPPGTTFLAKPVDIAHFTTAVRQLLEAPVA